MYIRKYVVLLTASVLLTHQRNIYPYSNSTLVTTNTLKYAVNIDQGIHKVKLNVARNEKYFMGFFIHMKYDGKF